MFVYKYVWHIWLGKVCFWCTYIVYKFKIQISYIARANYGDVLGARLPIYNCARTRIKVLNFVRWMYHNIIFSLFMYKIHFSTMEAQTYIYILWSCIYSQHFQAKVIIIVWYLNIYIESIRIRYNLIMQNLHICMYMFKSAEAQTHSRKRMYTVCSIILIHKYIPHNFIILSSKKIIHLLKFCNICICVGERSFYE